MASAGDVKAPRLLGVGSPIVDLAARVDDAFLHRTVTGGKGGTLHVSGGELEALVSRLPEAPRLVPGGSAGNTVAALTRLGVPAALLGKLGCDERGRFFLDEVRRRGGIASFITTVPGGRTGTCLTFTTPDGERTMRSDLGVSAELTVAEVADVDFRGIEWVLTEGYMVDAPGFEAIFRRARAAGCRIAFDPGSFELARQHRELFVAVLRDYAELALVNLAEAESLCGPGAPEVLAERLNSWSSCVVLKLGSDGALIKRRGEDAFRIPAVKVENVVDTTAAGDFFAAGFFYGILSGRSLRDAGACGARLAAAIVQVNGTELPADVWVNLRRSLAPAGFLK
jgi:sugar/nucleoside kinase (ribokinase family)